MISHKKPTKSKEMEEVNAHNALKTELKHPENSKNGASNRENNGQGIFNQITSFLYNYKIFNFF